MKKLTLLASFLIVLQVNSQDLSETIIGKWQVVTVEMPEMPNADKENIALLQNGLKNSIFHFDGHGVFNLILPDDAPEFLKELYFVNDTNWILSPDNKQVKIGTKSDGYSIMQLGIVKEKNSVYFFLVPMRLTMKKISSETKKNFIEKTRLAEAKESPLLAETELITKALKENEVYPFEAVEGIPKTKKCNTKNLKNDKLKKCVKSALGMHVAKKFNADLAQEIGLKPGKYKLQSQFVIDSNGNIINIEVTYESKADLVILKEEMIRVINLLPKMIPGSQNGKNVNVSYQLPLTFEVADSY